CQHFFRSHVESLSSHSVDPCLNRVGCKRLGRSTAARREKKAAPPHVIRPNGSASSNIGNRRCEATNESPISARGGRLGARTKKALPGEPDRAVRSSGSASCVSYLINNISR